LQADAIPGGIRNNEIVEFVTANVTDKVDGRDLARTLLSVDRADFGELYKRLGRDVVAHDAAWLNKEQRVVTADAACIVCNQMCARAQVQQRLRGILQRENCQALCEVIVTTTQHDVSLITHKARGQNRLLDKEAGVDDKLVEINRVGCCGVYGENGQADQESAHGGEYNSTGNVIFVAHRYFIQAARKT